ncbi:hypothetical protein QO009_002025 [Brevibacillus aydinogluensis]|uniref:hypothetical protein n=1 Tax=Brevibacillus aydinogluensis TaxID=927786 RepID=UPI002892C1AB|nr:hypothetical protein [Brevibacillus aydinogluensis]MDT3416157.1 hypothetical protein [Brevibacillus aydinogluensis]
MEDQVKSMDHKYLTPEEIAAIREFYQTLPLDLDSSVLAVRRDFLRLIDDWQVLMAENQRLREELELLQAEIAVWKGWRDKQQARTIELFEREKKLVEALHRVFQEYESEGTDIQVARRMRKIASDTLEELGIK